MTKDEALKLALVAFGEIDWSNNSQWQSDRAKVAIATLKEALANEALDKMAENARELGLDYEPEQEPVGEIVDAIEGAFKCSFTKMLPVGTKLYTTPPQRKPLSDEEIQDLLMPVRISGDGYYLRIARAIEAAHGIKENT